MTSIPSPQPSDPLTFDLCPHLISGVRGDLGIGSSRGPSRRRDELLKAFDLTFLGAGLEVLALLQKEALTPALLLGLREPAKAKKD